jgi:hypothetical protein
MPTLGVVVYSLRGMSHLPQCLESVQWADTVTICPLDQEEAAHISGGSGKAIQATHTDWVLHLWGDECVEDQLADALQRLRREDPRQSLPAYRVPIRSFLLGRWVEGSLWSPTPSMRLCRETRDFPIHWWDSQSPVHNGKATVLPGWINDYSSSDLAVGVERLNVVSSLWAQELGSDGRALSRTSLVTYPMWVLMRLLFVKGLVFQGMAGLSLSALSAYGTMVGGIKWHETSRSSGK